MAYKHIKMSLELRFPLVSGAPSIRKCALTLQNNNNNNKSPNNNNHTMYLKMLTDYLVDDVLTKLLDISITSLFFKFFFL